MIGDLWYNKSDHLLAGFELTSPLLALSNLNERDKTQKRGPRRCLVPFTDMWGLNVKASFCKFMVCA